MTEKGKFAAGEAKCERMGGIVASVHDTEQNNFLASKSLEDERHFLLQIKLILQVAFVRAEPTTFNYLSFI